MNCSRALSRILKIPPRERVILFEAALFLVLARLALAHLPFRLISKRLKQNERRDILVTIPSDFASEISIAIARATRVVSRATCLTRALAGTMMLARRGYPTTLCIGVSKRGDDLSAHAWVECGGDAVVGSGAGFSKILALPGAPS
jgi:hypothetical protein